MLHERTAPLADHDAVAVRDQSDTLVLYADRLTTAQRAALRRYLLDTLAEKEGPAATAAVAAGATELVLAGTKGRAQGVVPLSLTGTVMFTLAAGLLTAVFVTAVAILIVDAQRDQDARPLKAAAGGQTATSEPQTMPPQPLAEALSSQLEGSPPAGDESQPPPGLPVDLPGTAQQVVPPIPAPAGSVVSPGSVVTPSFTPDAPANLPAATSPPSLPTVSPSQEPPASPTDLQQPDVNLPDADLPSVDLPDTEIPDGGVSVDLPEVDLPDVELPDVDLPGVGLSLPDVDIPDVDIPDVEVSDEESSEDDDSGDESESDGEDGEPEDAAAGDSDE